MPALYSEVHVQLVDLVTMMETVEPLADLPGVVERRRWRLGAGVPVDVAAALVGVSARTVGSYERGEREPRLRNRRRYLAFLALARSLGAAEGRG